MASTSVYLPRLGTYLILIYINLGTYDLSY